MSRYIYITDDCLMDIAYEHMDDDALIGLQNALEEIPTADVVEVVHGEWVKDEEKSKKLIESIYICSACHNFEAWGETEKYNYCPNCGAKMDLKEVEDEQIH